MITYSLVIHLGDFIGLLRDGFPDIEDCFTYGLALEKSGILKEPYLLECVVSIWA